VGAYLAWTYQDAARHQAYGQVYWDDGRVESVDQSGRTELCRFGDAQLRAARAAVVELSTAVVTLTRGPAHDTATVLYTWSVDGEHGSLAYDYPPDPTAIDVLEQRLTELEEAVGGWPLLAEP
jgi:hypothetical protein